ncbi:MAG: hypothetical protein ACP5NL_01440 [Thermoplasmata archaeon]
MTNFKETLPQIKVVRKNRTAKKIAIGHDELEKADEKQVLCTIKKILDSDLEKTNANAEELKAHLDELNKELDYYRDLIESARKDATLMNNKIKFLSSENIRMKKDED